MPFLRSCRRSFLFDIDLGANILMSSCVTFLFFAQNLTFDDVQNG